jgi:hypothetical protein
VFPPSQVARNLATYGPNAIPSIVGSDCPVVVIYPEHLFGEVKLFFDDYVKRLKDKSPAHDSLRKKFKMKFSESFGVDLSTSTLP